MAIGSNVVNFLVKISGDVRDLTRDLRSAESDVERSSSRLETASGRASSFVRDNWQAGLAAAGTAVVAFGAKAIQEFQSVATEAGTLADTTGLQVEEASRWLAVMREYGVETGDIADAFNNINTKAAEGRLDELGIAAGTTNERVVELLKYISQVEDETERAALMAEFFGEEGARQFATVSRSAEDLEERLKAVSEQQVITPDELRKAREFKTAMNELNGFMRDLTILVGQALVPVLTDAKETIEGIGDAIDALPSPPGWLQKLLTANAFQLFKDLAAPLPGGSGDMARTGGEVFGPGGDFWGGRSGSPTGSAIDSIASLTGRAVNVINITTGADPQSVVNAIDSYIRSNGLSGYR